MSKKDATTQELADEALNGPNFIQSIVSPNVGIKSHYNNPMYHRYEIPDDYGNPTGDFAGYRPLHKRVAAAMVAGALNAEAKAMEDYDSTYFTDEQLLDIPPRRYGRYAEFDEIHDYMTEVQAANDRIEAAHEAVRRAQRAQSEKVYQDRIKDLETKLKETEEFRLAGK